MPLLLYSLTCYTLKQSLLSEFTFKDSLFDLTDNNVICVLKCNLVLTLFTMVTLIL